MVIQGLCLPFRYLFRDVCIYYGAFGFCQAQDDLQTDQCSVDAQSYTISLQGLNTYK